MGNVKILIENQTKSTKIQIKICLKIQAPNLAFFNQINLKI
jgi:hypothetical protein